jgi:hypothetical protein
MTQKHYELLNEQLINETQVALEFLNFYIVEKSFSLLRNDSKTL